MLCSLIGCLRDEAWSWPTSIWKLRQHSWVLEGVFLTQTGWGKRLIELLLVRRDNKSPLFLDCWTHGTITSEHWVKTFHHVASLDPRSLHWGGFRVIWHQIYSVEWVLPGLASLDDVGLIHAKYIRITFQLEKGWPSGTLTADEALSEIFVKFA